MNSIYAMYNKAYVLSYEIIVKINNNPMFKVGAKLLYKSHLVDRLSFIWQTLPPL